MLVSLFENMPYITVGYVILSLIVAVMIPLLYIKKDRKPKRLTKYKRKIITFIFTYLLGIMSIGCTTVLIPYAKWLLNGNNAYPYLMVVIVAVLLVAYVLLFYTIITTVSKTRYCYIKKSLSR